MAKHGSKHKKSTSAKKSNSKMPIWKQLLRRKPLIIAVIVIFAACFFVLSQSLFKAFPVKGQVLLLPIDKGQTYSAFIQDLNEKRGIKFPVVLKIYQKFFIHDTLKAGVYEIPQGTTVRAVLDMVSDSNNAQMNRVLVIEGTTYKQLKARLKSDPFVKKTILDLPDQEIMQRIGAEFAHPEGVFAPDTYFFAKGETDLNILQNLYQRQIKVLDQAWAKRASDLPYNNKYEALIMASIVEKETAIESERTEVAGVFVRRLKIGMRLQTDPTVIYGMGERYDGNIRRQDLRTPTAYNTYTINGLPPTPIALASARSIEAALHPDDSKSLYFVATGNGGHTFSNTLDEHNQAVRAYLQVLKQKRQSD